MPYFASFDRKQDRHLNRAFPGLVDVLPNLTESSPIGVAFPLGPNAAGRHLWKLNIDGIWVEGSFVLYRRTFKPVRR